MANIQKAEDLILSITEPETMEAVVQENSRNAAQKTPFILSVKLAPIRLFQG